MFFSVIFKMSVFVPSDTLSRRTVTGQIEEFERNERGLPYSQGVLSVDISGTLIRPAMLEFHHVNMNELANFLLGQCVVSSPTLEESSVPKDSWYQRDKTFSSVPCQMRSLFD